MTKTNLPSWTKYLARDEDGCLFAYNVEPYKKGNEWLMENEWDLSLSNDCSYIDEEDDAFKSIQWSDSKATSISDYLSEAWTPKSTTSPTHTKDTEQTVLNEGAIISYDEMMEELSTGDLVNKPNHYVGEQGLEVETVLQNFIPRYTNSYEAHRIASAIEYLLRSPLKNGVQDIEKAKKNLEQVLEYRKLIEED